MIDIKFIRENPKAVEAGAKAKNIEIDAGAILKSRRGKTGAPD